MPRKKKRSNDYFTLDTQNAILEYVSETNHRRRDIIYETYIYPVFCEMVEKIVFTFHYNNIPDVDTLKVECQAFLVTVLDKYRPTKGSAFSYFSVITKNWFLCKSKKIASRKEVPFEGQVKIMNTETIGCNEDCYEQDRERKEFWNSLNKEVMRWVKLPNLNENEEKVIYAIKVLLDNVDSLEIITRKSVYLYLREITDLPTKKIVIVLAKLHKKYNNFRQDWNSGNSLNR